MRKRGKIWRSWIDSARSTNRNATSEGKLLDSTANHPLEASSAAIMIRWKNSGLGCRSEYV